ncbi:PAS domain-containing sensor histidine kinase [Aminobacter sp. NyZ550]|jgi:two-component system nitrogen regulation sensor histidine kinase NtrY|uniref:histidine kinase n=3 Tax=Phyllobacteriaceae TaxID=69277 RepID=A0AAC8YQL9_AMIAI|nr:MULTISPECIES: PAS domain-containing sensor histidine kinase [Aminobacter]AMS42695.1 ATPase [Aminobacter aminovorans]MBA8910358.1 two-component system nitrogen regulation sensor histidine kinase NtrY [Aminobacter ciceronei]MBA9024129.1 two-component system nitrogen regulation sensor histidine kinase NtrY [Aminobacter ciceronei]MBB3704541.1 two-component system nitrogen regulation sensor histidine kinase NtrY [Aminobacter aminovorans]QNH32756.1 PAS domain-containing sensor histidine kinase [A
MASQAKPLNDKTPVHPRQEGRRLLALPGVLAIAAALVSAAVSFAILIGVTPITPDSTTTLALIAINAVLVLILVGLIAFEIQRIVMARKRGKAASRLHVRIVTMFALVAALPALLVAVVASITLDIGLDRWFQIRTTTIVNSSLSIAEAYVQENARNLQSTTLSMANDLDNNRPLYGLDRSGFLDFMGRQAQLRALAHAALISADGSFVMSAKTGADFAMPEPPAVAVQTAADGKPVLIEPKTRNIVGAIIKLREIEGLYLYTIRLVDPEVIKARQIVTANTEEYRDLGANRRTTQIAFALLYLGLTLIVVLSAIWTGIAVADRIVRPIRQLIGAADEVATGNLDVSVPVRQSDGDVGALSDTFNNMLLELKSQRNEILTAKDVIDERRRFSEAVLSGVTAGVIGVDPYGSITIVNPSAEAMLAISASESLGQNLSILLPHVGRVFEIGRKSGRAVYREQVTFYRAGAERTFNVQVTVEEGESEVGDKSYVVTIDDITDLVTAQRTSAWADVARRIAHEIKNPLTPIQLSAERIRRRYGKVITEDREVFDQCTETIIRQVGDIGRMVDEFSAFARMPKPEMKVIDIREPLREASFLVEVSRADIAFEREITPGPLKGTFDSRLMAQAFGNVIKNAAEAIEAAERQTGEAGFIKIRARRDGNSIRIDVIDNGKGLPRENRQRLLEPYMTTREKGTGLGLAIVKKIVEDHGGRLELHDAPADFHGGRGAMISMILPAAAEEAAAPKGADDAVQGRETEKVGNGV